MLSEQYFPCVSNETEMLPQYNKKSTNTFSEMFDISCAGFFRNPKINRKSQKFASPQIFDAFSNGRCTLMAQLLCLHSHNFFYCIACKYKPCLNIFCFLVFVIMPSSESKTWLHYCLAWFSLLRSRINFCSETFIVHVPFSKLTEVGKFTLDILLAQRE